MKDNTFSVLISIYYKENPDFLKQSLNSVFEQTLRPSEVVLVKDGELTNELEEVISQFSSRYPHIFRIIALEKNVGLGEALRIGLLHCTYEIVARMDSDDVCLPLRFEKQMSVLQKDTSIDITGSFIAEFENRIDEITSIRKVPCEFGDIATKARYRNPFNHQTVMFRKSAVIIAGNYKSFLWYEDYYLWVRMLIQNHKAVNIPEVLVYVRTGTSMFKRRGGFNVFINEVRFQKELLKLNFISVLELTYNIVTRGLVRLLPVSLRKLVYSLFLREKRNLNDQVNAVNTNN
ncbi:glycosyltransferase [Pseudobacteroides cellulosolvens]|uniref:Glycosyl transferase family 2 n=1 Tax=Pseudobacteroides cellulosolvens ATCC 35603 = DSM 2933 TaxID=398512 RepID=A0A0L6JM01_9FIRM|nr:glycosyltransferase [Pseudobacteroides cellulosolvens]KNY26831.1 glycosyl transferase family 2 [Pseudobacteroides cellulosolvens ATCC 35603 = DSM 2933]